MLLERMTAYHKELLLGMALALCKIEMLGMTTTVCKVHLGMALRLFSRV